MAGNNPPANYGEALDFLVRMALEPMWKEGPSFKRISGMRGYSVTMQSREQIWPKLIELLELNTKADTDRVRNEVRRILGLWS